MPQQVLIISLNGKEQEAWQIASQIKHPDTCDVVTNPQTALLALSSLKNPNSLVLIVGRPETGTLSAISQIINNYDLQRVALIGNSAREEASAGVIGISYIPIEAALGTSN